jgi:hypothetical protein
MAGRIHPSRHGQICEYGMRPDEAIIRKLFPFLQ